MKKNKKKQSLLIIALVAAVGIMSVAFALNATTKLTATGTADVPYAKWEVVFAETEGSPNFMSFVDNVEEEAGNGVYVTDVAFATSTSNQGVNTAVTYNLNFDDDDFGKTVKIYFSIDNNGTYAAAVDAETTAVDGLTINTSIVDDDFEGNISPVGVLEPNGEAFLCVEITVPAIAEPVSGNHEWGNSLPVTLTTELTATASLG